MPHGVGHGEKISGSLNGISRKRMARAIELQRLWQSGQTPCLPELLGNGGQVLACGFLGRKNPVVNENSVHSENRGVPIIHEIVAATTMSSLFVALFALVASSFRTRAAMQAEILVLRHQLAVCKRTRRVACASTAATGSCGLCCTDSGPVGGDVCRWFSPPRSSVGTAELSPGIGPGNHGAIPEGQKLQRTFAT